MKLSQRVRLVALSFAVVSVVGVLAAVACVPLAPSAPPNGAGNVSDSVSVPATEAPFVVSQSGDGAGDGEQGESTEEPTEEPTATRYVPPTADRSLCHVSKTSSDGTVLATCCPPDGHRAVAYILRQRRVTRR